MKYFPDQARYLWLAAVISLLLPAVAAAGLCTGRILNPITDICWKCVFPITVGGVPVASFSQEDFSEAKVSSPVCTCPAPPPLFVRSGVTISFWEPVRIVEVTREPYCFISIGGVKLAPGVLAPGGTIKDVAAPGNKVTSTAFYQVHYYIYPVAALIDMVTKSACMDPTPTFDLGYVTELDPLWASDELAFILNPEAVIFANPIAQMACAADCVAASAGFPLTPLFWCAGCQGSMYPLTGNIQSSAVTTGGVASSALLVQRMLYKLHRQGLLWGSIGGGALCGKYPMPIVTKGQYKTQLTYPVPETFGAGPLSPFCCQPLGRTDALWGLGKEYPVKGEDFAYLIWRKRNCCAF